MRSNNKPVKAKTNNPNKSDIVQAKNLQNEIYHLNTSYSKPSKDSRGERTPKKQLAALHMHSTSKKMVKNDFGKSSKLRH